MAKTKKNKSLRGRKKRGGTKSRKNNNNDFNVTRFDQLLAKYPSKILIDDVRTYINNLTSFTQMDRNSKKTVVGTLLWYWSNALNKEEYNTLIRDVIDNEKTKPEDITRHTLHNAVQRNNPEFVQLLVDKMSEQNKDKDKDVRLCSRNEEIMDILYKGRVIDAIERKKCRGMHKDDARVLATQYAFNKLKKTGKINEHMPPVLDDMREYLRSPSPDYE